MVGEDVYFRVGLDVIPPVPPVDGAMEGAVEVSFAIADDGALEMEGDDDEVELVEEEGERDGEEDASVEFLKAVGEDVIDGEVLGTDDVSTVGLLEMEGAFVSVLLPLLLPLLLPVIVLASSSVSVSVSVSISCALRCVCSLLVVALVLTVLVVVVVMVAPAANSSNDDLLVKARMKNRINDDFMIC